MAKKSSKKESQVKNNIRTSADSSSSDNSSPNRTSTACDVISNTSSDNNHISTVDRMAEQQSKAVADRRSNPDANVTDKIDFQTTSNTVNKRKQAPTTNQNNNKIPKTSVTTTSSITFNSDDHDNISDDDETNVQPPRKLSAIWQYATRTDDKSYAKCLLCNKRITTSNWSTTTLRNHLVKTHNKVELMIPLAEIKRNSSTITKEVKEKLHQLCVEAIIRGSLPFNTFDQPGLSKLMREAVPGKIQNSAIFFIYEKTITD